MLVAILGEPGPGDAVPAFHAAWPVIGGAAALCAVGCLGLGPLRDRAATG